MTERQYAGERPIGDLLRDLASGTQTLVTKELQLAKLELRETAQKSAMGAALLAGAAVLGLVGLIILALAAVYALSMALPAWVAALIVAGVLLVGAALLAMIGKNRLSNLNPRPQQTMETLKEDQEWVKQQLS